MTVAELIERLEDFRSSDEVRVASHKGWSQEIDEVDEHQGRSGLTFIAIFLDD